MRAVIIGGGIGGPVAAVALQRAGIEPVVHEAHDGPAVSAGLFLGLGVNGMRALRELDLLEPILGVDTVPTPLMEFSSTTGRRLGTVSSGWVDRHIPSITLMRGALQKALLEAARARGIEIHHRKRLVDYTCEPGGVVARFDDGSETVGDLLIGADGIHSRVRSILCPDAPSPAYTGLLNLGGVVADSALPSTPDTMRMIWGRRAFFGYTVRDDGEAWWFANIGHHPDPSRDELATVSADAWKRRLHALFADDPPLIRHLVDLTPEIGATPIHDLSSLPRWWHGRVALLGDAAHAVSPSAGQGASLAIEDGVVLGKCLRDVSPPEAALGRYEALRRPRAERIVATGRRRGSYKALGSRPAIWLRDLLMPLAFRFFATEARMSWIYDYRIGWEEPVTEAAV